tara:strand:+ start:53 stop:448 length:396 start_codon:yes stop_codon:yes gene_type:complete
MIKDIKVKNTLIAQLYNINNFNKSLFPTPDNENFQFGYGNIQEDKVLVPHIHKKINRKITNTSEFLYVINGEMEIDIFDESKKFIKKVFLKKNMALLQFIGGHAIKIKSGTKYFEVKQGPYLGQNIDKYTF